jgi:hypothetical protein
MAISFESNGKNEIFFVDGAEDVLADVHFDALTSASAHFIKCFEVNHEVDVYISKRSELESIVAQTRAYHMPPSFDRGNSIVCVFLNPNCSLEDMIVSLAHEMIHVWQVERGDFSGNLWKGQDLRSVPYEMRPWELEAFGNQEAVAKWFFEDRFPNELTLSAISKKTDEAFNALVKEISSLNMKKKLANVAKIAGAIGIGALIGL